ncbi:MAG: undecaprenyldiphospho-muramoylpentapeptide beta-N-acetylglucosaminyltransferase [Gammaproteobacteria bacterium]
MARRIVIMAGGTGGHVFPALAVAEWLRSQGWHVSWLGTKSGLESRVVPAHGIDIDWLSVAGVRGKGLMAKVKSVFLLLAACLQAWRILRKRKPDVVLGMGGFVAGPGGVMAKVLNIPVVIHEQNRVPGTTNRLLAKMADQVLEAFPGSFKEEVGAHWTGNPLREDFVKAVEKPQSRTDGKIRILVIGGSQGAKALNDIMPETAAMLDAVQIKHQTGPAMCEEVKQRYLALNVEAEAVAFIEDVAAAYRWADIVICRAGAMTVSEVAAVGVPAIFVPFPYAIDDHQVANARFLADAGGGVLLLQKDLKASVLAEQIKKVSEARNEIGNAAKACAKLDATKTVAEYCIAVARL